MLLKLKDKRNEIADVWSFVFEPSEPIEWQAGQFMRFELPHMDEDKKGHERWFTIASPPYEGLIQVTTRMTGSSFKKALKAMRPGGKITADGLEGGFVWPEVETPVVFVAAGIGVTPYYSMLKQRLQDGAYMPVTAIYGSRTNDILFKEELDSWSVQHPELKVFYKVGVRLTSENLREIIPDINDWLVYLSGPEPMVRDLEAQLRKSGVRKKQIVTDEFPGYDEKNY